MQPHRPPPRSTPRSPTATDTGGLPEILGEVADVITSPDAADLLGQVVEGVGTVVSTIGDIAS